MATPEDKRIAKALAASKRIGKRKRGKREVVYVTSGSGTLGVHAKYE
jgi:hypothetical protein